MNELASVLAELEAPAPLTVPLVTLKPARAKAFVRLAIELVKLHGPRPIFVQNTRLRQPIGHPHFLVDIDLTELLKPAGGNSTSPASDPKQGLGASFAFQATKEHLQRLLSVVGKSEVRVYDQGDDLVFANAHTQAHLLKALLPVPSLALALPADEHRLGEEIQLQGKAGGWDDLKTYIGKARYVMLLCSAGQLEQVQVQGKAPFTLRAPSGPPLGGQKPDSVYISQHFLALAGEPALTLSMIRNEDGVWLKTYSKPNLISNITTYERLYEGRIH